MLSMTRTLLYAIFVLGLGLIQVNAAVIPTDEIGTLIVGGQNATQGQFPYQIAIYSERSEFRCGASLINVDDVQVVLTAAHCLFLPDAYNYTIVSGKLAFNETSGFEQTRKVAHAVMHEDFLNGRPYPNDISILIPTSPFNLDNNTQFINLPQQREEEPSGNSTVIGWGRLGFLGPWPEVLQYVDMPVINWQDCYDAWTSLDANAIISKSQLCLGESTGLTSPCNGDSGSAASNDKGEVIGIVSWGENCATPMPAVFTKVSYYLDWIEEQVDKYKNNQQTRSHNV